MVRIIVTAVLAILSTSCLSATAEPIKPGPSFTNREVMVTGGRIHFLTGGHGSPVLLLHGFPETSYAWRNVMPGLALTHTVIVPDLPGIGGSQSNGERYDAGSMAEEIRALVLTMGFKKVDVVGHDFGVAVAYAYASMHRDEVQHLALLDVPPQGTRAFEKLAATAGAFSFQQAT